MENHLSGVCIVTGQIAFVIVEGCSKSQERYNKLMMRRLKWDDKKTSEHNSSHQIGSLTKCELLWKGFVKARTFQKFRTYRDLNLNQARKFLSEHGVEHYWDIV